MMVRNGLMSRKFDDFENLLPKRKRNVILPPVKNKEFYKPRSNPGISNDYDYDYFIDRAPGYDIYNSNQG